MSVHFFDVDHTLVRGSTARHYLQVGVRMGLFPRREILRIPFVYLGYRLGLLSTSILEQEMPSLVGKTRKELESVAQRSFSERIEPVVYQDAVKYMNNLRSGGDFVVIATSSVDFVVNPLARYLSIADVIASSLEFAEGTCNGRFRDKPTFGVEKRERVLAFLDERGLDPSTCSFYSDSVYDLPLLEAVGTPVAVNPDVKLAIHARRQGWKILHFSS